MTGVVDWWESNRDNQLGFSLGECGHQHFELRDILAIARLVKMTEPIILSRHDQSSVQQAAVRFCIA